MSMDRDIHRDIVSQETDVQEKLHLASENSDK